MWQFLQDAATSRAPYENITETLEYPSKFCVHHWSENEKKQTNRPMISFMADVLGNIVQDFFNRIILKDVFREANKIYKLI